MTVSPPVVVLGGEGIALSVARSLGATGIEVYALGDGDYDPVAKSRFCTHFIDLGSGEGVQDRWLEWLATGPRPGFVFPCNDDALELLAHSRSTIIDLGYSTVEADDRVLLAMLDKEQTYALARKAGVETPATAVVESEADLEAAAARIGFPCGLKPRHAHHLQHHFGLGLKLLVANDYPELLGHWELFAGIKVSAVVTEIIPGPDSSLLSCLSYIDADGEPLIHSVKAKIRQYPPTFGLGCYHMSVSDPEVVDAGLRFFQGIGLRGLAYVEFKRDQRDQSLKLIECNHRLGAGVELFRAAGLDLPLFVYSRSLGLPTPPIDRYRTGVYLWHPLSDTRSFLDQRRKGELTFRAWAKSLAHRQNFPVFRADDPKPTIVQHWKMARHVLQRSLGGD